MKLAGLLPYPIRRARSEWKSTRAYADWLVGGSEKEAPFLPMLCHPWRNSVDVGANFGAYTWLMRKCSRAVISFERNPDLAMRLKRIYCLDRRVSVRNCAVSDTSGMVQLRIPEDHDIVKIGPRRVSFGEARTILVAAVRLDDCNLGDVGFIKINVKGQELSVLKGGEKLIQSVGRNF